MIECPSLGTTLPPKNSPAPWWGTKIHYILETWHVLSTHVNGVPDYADMAELFAHKMLHQILATPLLKVLMNIKCSLII